MATFDQLPADQRAIIELVLKRGRTYDALSDMLDMPASRVRDLARDALTQLAPRSAERVDPDWRDQVADYALGQQSGPESTATQGHLRRSEPARAWLLSLLDSLDQLYQNGKRPEVPEGEAERPRARERSRRRDREPAAAVVERDDKADADADDEADEDRDSEKKSKPDKAEKAKKADSGAKAKPAARGRLSPAAQAAVKRRRLMAGIAGALVLLVAAFFLVRALTGDDDDGGTDRAANTTNTTAQERPELLGQLALRPVEGGKKNTAGAAVLGRTGGKMVLVLRAQLPPRPAESGQAYEVWLYNSDKDAISLGAQNTDAQGLYQGRADLPADYEKYKFIDISAERIDRNGAHSGRSVLRGALADMQAPPPPGQNGAQGGAGGGQPAPGQPAPGQPAPGQPAPAPPGGGQAP